MKQLKYYMTAAVISVGLFACDDDDDKRPGNPVMANISYPQSALFGDSIAFSADVSDNEVALSTLKAQLYYGEEMVSETVIRTKTSDTYSGKILAPFHAHIPNGTATLQFVLQNVNLTKQEQQVDMPLSRPDFPYLTLQTADGDDYRMERTSLYNYAVTAEFPQKVKAVIIAPAGSSSGQEIQFGWSDNQIKENETDEIPFSNDQAGEYTITFNTLTYAATPFISLTFDGEDMQMVDDDRYKVERNFTQGQKLTVTGISNLSEWWIDPDYFILDGEELTFLPLGGKYRVTADFQYNYFKVELMDGDNTAQLNEDGTGAVWIIGEGVGKPSLDNAVGWDTGKAICVAQKETGKYQVTLVAGETIDPTNINFKFFHQKDWGGEFGSSNMSNTSTLFKMGEGEEVNGTDDGNIVLQDGVTLTEGKSYLITVDVTGGINNAKLIVEEK